MSLSYLNPMIRFCRRMYVIPRGNQGVVCYDCRLFYIHQGTGYIRIDKERFPIKESSAVFLPAGTHYHLHMDRGELEMICMDFDLTDEFCHITESLGTVAEEAFDPTKVKKTKNCQAFAKPIVLREAPEAEHGPAQCVTEFLTKAPHFRERASALLKETLITLLRSGEGRSAAHRVAMEALRYIHAHYSDPELSNRTVAEAFGYHPYHMGKLLKEATGISLHRHIISYRITVSKNLLITTGLDISEVAWKCGFSTVSYFIEAFHKEVGMTPAKYRKAKEISHI